jgi:hypothetical protein
MTRAQQIAMFARGGKRKTLKQRSTERKPSLYNPRTFYPPGHKGNTPKTFSSVTPSKSDKKSGGPSFPSNPGYHPTKFQSKTNANATPGDVINWIAAQAHGGEAAAKGPSATQPYHKDPLWDKKWPKYESKTLPPPPQTAVQARVFQSKTRKKSVAVKYGMNTESSLFKKPVLPKSKTLPPIKSGPKLTPVKRDAQGAWWHAFPDAG